MPVCCLFVVRTTSYDLQLFNSQRRESLPAPVTRARDLRSDTPHAASPLPLSIAQTADKGALPTLRAATDPGALGGQYYGPDGVGQQRGNPVVVASSDQSYDLDLQRRLWAVSEELTKVVFPVG